MNFNLTLQQKADIFYQLSIEFKDVIVDDVFQALKNENEFTRLNLIATWKKIKNIPLSEATAQVDEYLDSTKSK